MWTRLSPVNKWKMMAGKLPGWKVDIYGNSTTPNRMVLIFLQLDGATPRKRVKKVMFGDADKKVCGICDDALECATLKVVSVRERDLRSFITKSKKISDRKWKIWSRHTSVLVHTACRVWYSKATIKNVAAKAAKLKALSTSSAETSSTSARISESPLTKNKFNFRDLCLICAKPWKEKNKQGSVIHNDYMKLLWAHDITTNVTCCFC
ncbi:PREDICTED: uncharacterized protein LOC106792479 [Polistes canadensis]|uniref:uncharacterized protein LOC106792479 n=1 Tax=Polistes canadensis TaxID=91411 RepID=UPI000718E185|nr:PREDICTED: uncharacterized protein LOC106792479 [Polistes canadensis]